MQLIQKLALSCNRKGLVSRSCIYHTNLSHHTCDGHVAELEIDKLILLIPHCRIQIPARNPSKINIPLLCNPATLVSAACSDMRSSLSSSFLANDTLPLLLTYDELNYTAVLNESHPSTMLVGVSYEAIGMIPQFLFWKHNGQPIGATEDPRIAIMEGGSLEITDVRPSDAGFYRVVASNGAQCQSVRFTVFVQCEW